MYYAEYHEYGTNTISHGDVLARFETKEARDEWCERINKRNPFRDVWEPVTTREVAHRYNFSDFENGDKCWEVLGERGMDGRIVSYIGHKPSYVF